jgi:drug/metabolite transporter (DMT)-like permease
MSRGLLLLILTSVLMSSAAQIVLKAGMSTPAVANALSGSSRWSAATAVALNPLVLTGLTIYFASALVWLLVLARAQVSQAYPFVGLGFVVTMVLGWWVYGDQLSIERVAGTVMIALGAVLVGRS